MAAWEEEPVIDLALGLALLAVVAGLYGYARQLAKRTTTRMKQAKEGGPRLKPRYEWEPVSDRYSRRARGVARSPEDHDGILAFIESRTGVEAYMEPKTVMHPLSVLLVAGDGESRRFELADDAFIRELARTRSLPVFDAGLTGYPERMRTYRRPSSSDGPRDDEGGRPGVA